MKLKKLLLILLFSNISITAHAFPGSLVFFRDQRPSDGVLFELKISQQMNDALYSAIIQKTFTSRATHGQTQTTQVLAENLSCELLNDNSAMTNAICIRDSRHQDNMTLELNVSRQPNGKYTALWTERFFGVNGRQEGIHTETLATDLEAK